MEAAAEVAKTHDKTHALLPDKTVRNGSISALKTAILSTKLVRINVEAAATALVKRPASKEEILARKLIA